MKYTSPFATLKRFGIFVMLGALALTAIESCTYDKAEEPEPLISGPVISFKDEIQPIIANNCLTCHSTTATNPEKPGYAFFDKFDELKMFALKPSTSNPVYTVLQARLRAIEFPRMPFKQAPLPESDIKKIEAWIKAGAPNN